MDAHSDAVAAQALNRQSVINFGGLRVIDGIGFDSGQRQFSGDGWRLQRGESRSLGEMLKQKTLPVKVVSGADGACFLQQHQWRGLALFSSLDNSFVLGGVFIGLEENLEELCLHLRRAAAKHEFLCPI